TPHYRHFAGESQATLALDPRSAATFLVQDEPPPIGAPIVQPDLARTLEEIASEGAETFYHGRLARRFATGLERAGILVSAADLASFAAEIQEPIAIDYR